MKGVGASAAVLTLAKLAKFARGPLPSTVERCDGCGAGLVPEHEHRLLPAERRLECMCPSCAVIQGPAGSPWKRVRRRAVSLGDFEMTESEWEGLRIPIRLAFFVVSDDGRAAAFFPSPAGATESMVDADAWTGLRARSPHLATMKADVEALLVNRVGAARDHYLVSIDACYALVGTLRTSWRGFSGGDEVWSRVGKLMSELAREAESASCPA
jgi:hypothetical protein